MTQWIYDRLPRGVDSRLADSLLTSYGDTEQQARFFQELGVNVPDATKFWPYQQDGQWKIGPGVSLGPVGGLTEAQQQTLSQYQQSGMSRIAGYQKIVDTVTDTTKQVRKNLAASKIRGVPQPIVQSLAEAALYKPVNDVFQPEVVQALRSRDYVDVAARVTTNTAAPAQLASSLGERIVTEGSTVAREDIVNSIMRNTARNETGVANYTRMNQIQPEQNGTKSYGILGLNSGRGTSGETFVDRYGDELGLTAKIGTPEFDQQWLAATANNSERLLAAHEAYVNEELVKPARQKLVTAGLGKLANDAGVINTVADTIVQMGPGLTDSALRQVNELNVDSPDQFFDGIEQVTIANVDSNFKTHLSNRPQDRAGLINRLKRRAQQGRAISADNRTLPRPRSLSGTPNPVQTPEPAVARNNQTPTPAQEVNAPAAEVLQSPEVALTSIEREVVPEILNSGAVSSQEDATVPPVFDPLSEVDFAETILSESTRTAPTESDAEPVSLLQSLIPSDGSPPDVNRLRNDPVFSEAPGNETQPLLADRSEAGRRQRALAELRQFPIEEQRQAILDRQREEAARAVDDRTFGLVSALTSGGQADTERAGAALDNINASVQSQGSATNANLRAAAPRESSLPLSAVNSLLSAQRAQAELNDPDNQALLEAQATRQAVNRENVLRSAQGLPAITVQDTLPILAQADSIFNTVTENQRVRDSLALERQLEQNQLKLALDAQTLATGNAQLNDIFASDAAELERLQNQFRDPTALTSRLTDLQRRRR